MSFTPFDPLEFKNTRINDAALRRLIALSQVRLNVVSNPG